MNKNEQWLKWAVELQAIAQGGLFYGKDKFDIERYVHTATFRGHQGRVLRPDRAILSGQS